MTRFASMRPVLAALIVALSCTLAVAQEQQAPAAATDASGLSEEQLRELVETLEDPVRRDAFLSTLKSLLAAKEATEAGREQAPAPAVVDRMLATINQRLQHLSSQLGGTARLVTDMPALGAWTERQWTNDRARMRWMQIAVVLAVVLVAGWLTGWLRLKATRRAREQERLDMRETYAARVLLGLVDLVTAFLPILGFAGLAYLALAAAPVGGDVRAAGLAFVFAIAAYQVVMALTELLLAPESERRRLMPLADETASYAYVWVRRFAFATAAGYAVANSALALGLPEAGYFTLSRAAGLVIAALAAVLVLQKRGAVATRLRDWLSSHTRLAFLARVGDVWHLLALLYVVGFFAVWAIEIEGGFAYLLRASVLTVIILAVAWGLVRALSRRIDRALTLRDEQEARFPHLRARAERYRSVVGGVFRLIVVVVAGLAVLEAWDLGLLGALGGGVGREIVASIAQIAIVVVLAVVIWEVTNNWIESYLTRADADGNLAAPSQRAQTLLPMLRTALLIVLVVVAGMAVLSELGVNITPLLAGAGVVGLAVGFGAQKLVQDVITGIFILFEDTIQVGDVATAGGHTGVIEHLSIRTIRMRDLEGWVHTVPFSDVTTVVNLTKDYATRLFEVGVAYREDTDQVTGVLKEIAEELRNDPDFGPDILDPLEVLGVDRFDDSAVIIRVRLKVRPMRQWAIGREFNRRMKKRFDELGIEIPFPHRTLYFGVDKEGDAPAAPIRLTGGGRAGDRAEGTDERD